MRLNRTLSALLLALGISLTGGAANAQPLDNSTTPTTPSSKKWYETISLRGYIQLRYNRLLETNADLGCAQCDASWGGGQGFFIRRARLVVSGQISKRVSFYLQPDFASATSSDKLNYLQMRDAYFDIGIDEENKFRFRLGQSKVPYGFENMQSSSNRAALDRSDGINTGIPNERDIGVFFYYASKEKRELFKELTATGLKGSGDFGVVGFGVFNGQTSNKPELNNQQHVVGRITYPFRYKGQIIEAGLQAYAGQYVIAQNNLSPGVKYVADRNYTDRRVAGSFILYPKPIGFQAEYNVGQGPRFNKETDSIEVSSLNGGYAQVMGKFGYKSQLFYPFVRYQYYDGGKKQELDARSYTINDLEVGMEWLPFKQLELNATYTISRRRYEDFQLQNNLQTGSLLRLQAQVNF